MDQLKRQRAALEALATTLESMEEDARIATIEFKAAAKSTKQYMEAIEKEAVRTAQEAEEIKQEDPLVVMLASSSKWRRALIAQILPDGMVLADDPISPDIDEKAIRREIPEDMVKAIAHGKADKVISVLASGARKDKPTVDIVICVDQVVCFGDQVREKPSSKQQAKEHLQSYGATNTPARCVSGLVVAVPETGSRFEGTDVAFQYFKPVPDKVADALIAKGDVMYCAGSFVVEDPLLAPYLSERVGEIESVQGMPKELTRKLVLDAAQELRKHRRERAVSKNSKS